MKLTAWIGLSLAIYRVAAGAPMSADERAVWKAEFTWNNAYVGGDAAKLAEVEDKNYVYTEDEGTVDTRETELAQAQAGEMHFSEMSLHEATVRITGDTAVITGRLVVAGGLQEPFGEINATTDILARVHGVWKAVASSEVHLASNAQTATTPLWRDTNGWRQRHEQFVAEAKKGAVDLLFVGDSITDFWRNRGKAVWDQYFGNLHAANIGIAGDRTQHVLWRLEHGEIDGLRPKAVVLMIGTNNVGLERDGLTPCNTTAQTAAGVKAVVAALRQKLPGAKILLLAIFPRSHAPDDPARRQIAEINKAIAGLDDGDHIRYLDIGARFLAADGMLEADIMPDFLHPSVKGYEIWAQAIREPLAQMLDSSTEPPQGAHLPGSQ